MATLHVRNVPDDLYERLRESAVAEGRSIGAQATVLIRDGLFWHENKKQATERMVVRTSPFKRRFAEQATTLVLRGQELAQQRGAQEVAPAHVLLAMLEDPILAPTLERGGVTVESVTAALPAEARPSQSRPPVSQDARRMLENALLAALDV